MGGLGGKRTDGRISSYIDVGEEIKINIVVDFWDYGLDRVEAGNMILGENHMVGVLLRASDNIAILAKHLTTFYTCYRSAC